ncbi:MAG: glycosyltransferase family 39 protein [Victivallales bacterium]|jgi:4-amino-4-deoxy-L-arabinose transferase-like glycosyltransferase|nr:glycosyltransferase family 39 protein [Victivallales bacterium]
MNRICNFLRDNRVLLLLFVLGFLLRLALALPGYWSGADLSFARPDTPGYLGPAQALAQDNAYLDSPGGVPNCGRAPGFPFFASLFFRLFGMSISAVETLVFGLILVGSLIPLAVYWAGKVWFDRRIGLWACGFTVLNLTMIANSPMLLSDTLFGLFVALTLGCYGMFYKHKAIGYFFIALFLAGIGALIRPINSVWVLPALFLIAVTPELNYRKKCLAAVGGATLFLLVIFPWMGRNAALGAGWVIDTNTGAMYHQNGAMLLSKVNHSGFEEEKAKILAELEKEFADKTKYPDLKSQSDYRKRQFLKLILAHPLAWLPQHFKVQILLPDAPTFFEILGITSGGRGTMDVMQKSGVLAAVNHYFNGKTYILLPVLPLLLVTLVMYIFALMKLFDWVIHIRHDWYMILIFLAFVEYYFFLPGPIVAPRYQIPALPLIAIMASTQVLRFCNWLRRKE